jgi:hypothetical protein
MTNKKGEIATTLTIASLIVMLVGVIIGRNQAVRENVQKYISSAQVPTVAPTPPPSSKCPKASCQVRLVKDTLKVYQDQSDPKIVHLDGNFCFAGEAVSGTHQGRLWLSKDSGGKNVVGPVRHYTLYPGNTWPGPCDRDGVLLKNKQMNTPSSENSFSITVSLSDFGTASCPLIYFNYVSTGGGGETYDDRGFVALNPLEYGACGPTATPRPSNTPTPGPTNSPTPTTAGACSLNLTAYLKERMSDGTLRDMTEIVPASVKWYAMNDQQIARHGTAYNPQTAAQNWYGFTNGKIVANVANVTWPIKVASDDTSGHPYVYQKGSRASVRLSFDADQYEIESVDPGPGTVANTSTKDTVANLLLDCGQNYSYGWVMKKKATNSCPLRTTENAEKCKPKNVRAEATSSHEVRVNWDSMTDTACPFDVYSLDVVEPTDGGKIVCHQGTISKSTTSATCDVRTNREGTNRTIDYFVANIDYTASIYLLKNQPPGCFSNPGNGVFHRTSSGTDGSKRSHQLDVWDINNQNDMCFISA